MALALLQEVVEPADADHVAFDAFDFGALRDRHLGLRDGALALHVDRGAAEEMIDAHAIGVALQVGVDELLVGALKPGRPHPAFRVPDRPEAVPLQAVAPHRPVLDQLADCELVVRVFHFLPPGAC